MCLSFHWLGEVCVFSVEMKANSIIFVHNNNDAFSVELC